MERFTVQLANVHCDECSISIHRALKEVFDVTEFNRIVCHDRTADKTRPPVVVFLSDGELVIVGPGADLAANEARVLRKLESCGFDVISWDISNDQSRPSWTEPANLVLLKAKRIFATGTRQKHHRDHCKKCREEYEKHGGPELLQRLKRRTHSDSEDSTVVDVEVKTEPLKEYRALLSCAAYTERQACLQCVADRWRVHCAAAGASVCEPRDQRLARGRLRVQPAGDATGRAVAEIRGGDANWRDDVQRVRADDQPGGRRELSVCAGAQHQHRQQAGPIYSGVGERRRLAAAAAVRGGRWVRL
ncbi:hypothetical protein KL911_002696 [Ogataea haglerorum]|uniref:uncharacterized protein n=1 Tax=Ogataea haglerorum TaxID=1937702 RepID=UPI001C89B71D|nr:uncharacterized protein KL911_002696 [Ogataea haglerorum]KAG7753303.1 hypothetical protein KL911_002696 [Ogataea haglerorum]